MSERLNIYSNAALTNLDGLANLSSIAGDYGSAIVIWNNPQLNQCCSLCPLFAADAVDPIVIGGSITISGNNTGCNSQADIEACMPCATCVADLTLNTSEVGSLSYTASNSIISTDTIASGENVLYEAGNLTELRSGFSAAATSNFSVTVGGDCQ